MYRREKDLAHTRRAWKRFVKIRSSGWWATFNEPGVWSSQEGRFRKGSGLGCPYGRGCGCCGYGREPTRQKRRSDIDFEEWKEDSVTGFM